MGDTDPTGPVMDRDEVDRALARLGAEHEAIETSLLALQDHAGRRLLEGARLTGLTRERWTVTEAAITLLWTYFDAYTDALRTARDVRARRRWSSREDLVELTELLRGECVTVAGSAAAAAGAPAPDGSGGRLSERYSLAALVDRMNGLYASSLDVVVAADVVWSALPARIDLLAAELQRTRELAHSVGVRPGEHPAGDDLERITRTLTRLREQVISDPLAFWQADRGSSAPGGGRPDTTVYDREARALEDVRREIDAVLTVRQDAEKRIVRLRDVLSRADRTLAEARTARGEVLAKIAATEVPVVSGPPTALQEQLSTAAEYRRHAQWHRLSPPPGVPGAEGGGRTAARPRVVDRGHRAPGGPRRAARPPGRVQGEGGPARPRGGPPPGGAVREGAPHAVERALRPARRRTGGAALPAGGRGPARHRAAGARSGRARPGRARRPEGGRRMSDEGEAVV
ncbi:hypothetical protein GCM10019016_052460 [Streptomyces prasinosporus]|uniref:Uncharacterized protein n=1 Tax=Streptomyces prasinosporus TaxID=68256 RepID=A0ABP6TTS7_9ACTN